MRNLAALAMVSGVRVARTRLANRQRRFGLRLVRLPQEDMAREVVKAPVEIGQLLSNALAYSGRNDSTILLEETETLDAVLRQEEEAKAKAEAEKDPLDSHVYGRVTAGKWCCWLSSGTDEQINLERHQNPHGLQPGSLRRGVRCSRPCTGIGLTEGYDPGMYHHLLGRAAAIWRMASEEPGPKQQHANQALNHSAAMRRAQPGITIQIR